MYDRFYTLPCKISRGGFSEERAVRVTQANGQIHLGAIPRHYCYKSNGEQVTEDEPATGEQIKGRVVARLVREEPKNQALVYLPDGEVILVNRDQISNFEGSNPHVSIES